MNENTPKATFSFSSHKITEFSFKEPGVDQPEIAVQFFPSGEYNTAEGIFKLILIFTATYGGKGEHTFSAITSYGYFQFPPTTKLDAFPDYFYANSIAILYPYLRAFLTTLTAVANIKPLILPTLNLQALAKPLKENVSIL